jgi:hypothetical protein
MAGITTHLSILILNINRLNFPINKHHLANWIKKEVPIIYLQETQLIDRNKHWLKVKCWKRFTKPMTPESRQE